MGIQVEKPVIQESFFKLPSLVSTMELICGVTAKIAATGRLVLDTVDQAARGVSGKIVKGIRATRLFGALDIVYNAPVLLNSIRSAVISSKPTERVQHIWQAVTSGGDVVDGAIDTVEGFRVVGLIAETTLNWVEKIVPFLFPFKVIGLMRSSYSFAENHEFYKEMKERLNYKGKEALEYVMENAERIESTLEIAPEVRISRRAQDIITKLGKDEVQAQKEAVQLLDTLKGRVNRKFGLDVASVAMRVAETMTIGLLTFLPPNPVTFAVMGGLVALNLVHMGVSKLILKKNPFAHMDAMNAVKQPVANTTNLVDRLKKVFV